MTVFPIHARVAFIGDSITASVNFTARVAAFYVRHLPHLGVTFKNAGVSGGSANSALLYYDASVASFHPTHALIMLGVNDSDRDALNLADETQRTARLDAAHTRYVTRMNELIDRLECDGVSVALCTPAPYAEYVVTDQTPLPGGYALIRRYAETVRSMARERGLPLVDFHAALSEYYLCETIYNPDHVHPNDRGHHLMAGCILSSQGLTPEPYRALAEELSDLPLLAEWNSLAGKITSIYAVEWMVVCNFDLPKDEKLALVQKTIDDGKWNGIPYFQHITANYMKNKPHEEDMLARMDKIWGEIYNRYI